MYLCTVPVVRNKTGGEVNYYITKANDLCMDLVLSSFWYGITI
jgi:hypothetical protein